MGNMFIYFLHSFRLYSHVEGHEPVVLIIKTMDEEVTVNSTFKMIDCVCVLIKKNLIEDLSF